MIHSGNREKTLADNFSASRSRLLRIAYAVLGSYVDAEDVVSECWLRLIAADESTPVQDVEAWCVVAVSRLALDVLRSARVRREVYVGPWLPEPLVTPVDPTGDRVSLSDSVGYALLVVLESLSPAERTAWVLHDLFGLPFDEVSDIVGRTPASVRQLASRARSHVRERTPRFEVSANRHAEAVRAFVTAAETGDMNTLLEVLDPNVILVTDGGGVVSAARRPVEGADRVARFLLGIAAKIGGDLRVRPCVVNGSDGLALAVADTLAGIVSLEVGSNRSVTRIDIVRTPDKLTLVSDAVWR